MGPHAPYSTMSVFTLEDISIMNQMTHVDILIMVEST